MCTPIPKQKAEMMFQRFKQAYPKKSKDEIRELTIDAVAEMMRVLLSNYQEKKLRYWEQVKEEIEKL